MSYVIGLRLGGVSSIISDTLLTRSEEQGEPIGVKTGVLLPGCIYGLSGAAKAGYDFINHVKNALGEEDDVSLAWNKFSDFVCFCQTKRDPLDDRKGDHLA